MHRYSQTLLLQNSQEGKQTFVSTFADMETITIEGCCAKGLLSPVHLDRELSSRQTEARIAKQQARGYITGSFCQMKSQYERPRSTDDSTL